jgi:transposase
LQWCWAVRHRAWINAYSEDPRKKIVEAVERGTPKVEVARSFGVGISSVKRFVPTAEACRPLAPKMRPGSKPTLNEIASRLLEADLREHSMVMLLQRHEFLGRMAGMRLSKSTLSRMLKRMGWTAISPGQKRYPRILATD